MVTCATRWQFVRFWIAATFLVCCASGSIAAETTAAVGGDPDTIHLHTWFLNRTAGESDLALAKRLRVERQKNGPSEIAFRDWGWVGREALNASLRDVVFSLKPKDETDVILSVAGATLARVEARRNEVGLEFSAYLKSDGEHHFVITDKATGKPSEWLRVGESFQDAVVRRFDAADDLLHVERRGEPLALSLKGARVRDASEGDGQSELVLLVKGETEFVLNATALTIEDVEAVFRKLAAAGAESVRLNLKASAQMESTEVRRAVLQLRKAIRTAGLSRSTMTFASIK